MIDTASFQPAYAGPGSVAPPGADAITRVPPQPKNLRETGLEPVFLSELVVKTMYAAGRIHLPVLTSRLHLSFSVVRQLLEALQADQLVEISGRGDSELDVYYQLSAPGRLRAAEFLARSRYVGPAPVPLGAYRELVLRQSRHQDGTGRVSAADLARAFAGDSLEPGVRELIGAALQSSRSLLLYGPSGSGKTTLAHKLGRLQHGIVAVPYAIMVEHDIVLCHDPLLHAAPAPGHLRNSEERRSTDSRYALCQRPLVTVGAELDASMLDLRYDKAAGAYRAPPHFLANNGLLVVDDLGRQRMPLADLLGRWSAPMECGADQLTLAGGHKLAVPFDVTLVLTSSLAPQVLLDDALMRRVGYKIHVGALGEAGYRALFQRQCEAAGLACDEAVIGHLITHLHGASGRALLASVPAELLGRIADFASYHGTAPALTIAAVEQAWVSMFGHAAAVATVPAPDGRASDAAQSGDFLAERIS